MATGQILFLCIILHNNYQNITKYKAWCNDRVDSTTEMLKPMEK